MVNRACGNKLLYICQLLGVQLDGLTLPNLALPTSYWHYEASSEKITSIFLHIIAENNLVTVIEGKKYQTLNQGIIEVDLYAHIENEYLINNDIGYAGCNLYRAVSIFGGRYPGLPHNRVLIYIDIAGNIYINPAAPASWRRIFHNEGII